MSSASDARNPSFVHRQTSTSRNAKPDRRRVVSGLPPERENPPTYSPQPSSNGPLPRRTASASAKPNGDANMVGERRTEKTRLTTRENITVRTRSPVKEAANAPASRKDRGGDKPRAKERTVTTQKDKVPPQGPWAPHASLVPHTTAPLASRISLPPRASQAPAELQPEPLKNLSLEAQEAAILEDLLFVFMGYEGQYVHFVESYNPSVEKDRLAGPNYRILPGLDPSLRDLTSTMLKMATHYSAIEAFIDVQSRDEFGTVNHALCAAMRKLLKDYLTLIAQLEHQLLTNPSFTLHLLHLHTLPTAQTFLHLYSLAHEILRRNSLLEADLDESMDGFDNVDNILESLREGGDLAPGTIPGKKICKGGNVLGLLTRRLASMSGDPAARTLLSTLLREASRPYMAMLNEWLHHGGIKDPHTEFLIKEQRSIRRERLEEDYTDEYWEKRYTIRENECPPQLEAVKDKVLLAGKYLNVVRECGGVDVSKEVKDVPKTFDDVRFLDNVNSAYRHANSSLLNLLLTTHALPARLRSLKHYFFLDRSDFFTYFLEIGEPELQKPVHSVNVGRLQSLLDLVLRQSGSVAALDPFKEDVKVQMNEVGLTNWLMRIVNVTGLDQEAGGLDSYQTPATHPSSAEDDKAMVGYNALELDYSVPFPLSLVISRKTVLRYQLLFRYLLSLRRLETLLTSSWVEHTKLACWQRTSANRGLEMWKRRVWTLRARMLVFVQQLLYFCTAEVIEPNWQALMSRLGGEQAKDGAEPVLRTVDELMQDHVDFLDTCLKECMLTNSKLLRVHSKMSLTCSMFASYTERLTQHLSTPSSSSPSSSTTKPPHSSSSSSAAPDVDIDPARLTKMQDTLTRYEMNFARHLKILLDALNYYAATETVVFLSLCARLTSASGGEGGGVGGDG
ncbi:MAG: hypothetical protein M1833_004580 [Piccolia ochrophora]|nr:MAG: hypothetical protein M1833_004580 [Piccolia ochrophora]